MAAQHSRDYGRVHPKWGVDEDWGRGESAPASSAAAFLARARLMQMRMSDPAVQRYPSR